MSVSLPDVRTRAALGLLVDLGAGDALSGTVSVFAGPDGLLHRDSRCRALTGGVPASSPPPSSGVSLELLRSSACACCDRSFRRDVSASSADVGAWTVVEFASELLWSSRLLDDEGVPLVRALPSAEAALAALWRLPVPPGCAPARDVLAERAAEHVASTRARLASPAGRSEVLLHAALGVVASEAMGEVDSGVPLALLAPRHVGEEEGGEELASILVSAWEHGRVQGLDFTARLALCLAECDRWQEEPRFFSQVDFVPGSAPPAGVSLRDWLVSEWRLRRADLVRDLVVSWDARVEALLAGSGESVAVGFLWESSFVDDVTSAVLAAFPSWSAQEGVVWGVLAPPAALSWLVSRGFSELPLSGVAPADVPRLVETTLGLWTPSEFDESLGDPLRAFEAASAVLAA